jgi:hypothetical protein
MTYVATLSHLRRINTPIEKTGKLVQPRKLHATQWGIVCPAETPEGASVGLVKNMALLTNVTVATPSEPVRQALAELGLVPSPEAVEGGRAPPGPPPQGHEGKPWEGVLGGSPPISVFVNGDPVGTHGDPPTLYAALKALKRSGAISVFTSIAWNVMGGELCICTEGGRFVRPLLVVAPADDAYGGGGGGGRRRPALLVPGPVMSKLLAEVRAGTAAWHDLVLAGAIEYIDADEANCTRIGFLGEGEGDIRYAPDGCELLEVSRSAMLGVVAGSIPFSDHNQVKSFLFPRGPLAVGLKAHCLGPRGKQKIDQNGGCAPRPRPGMPGSAWGYLGMPGSARGCSGMPGSARGCSGMPGSARGCSGMLGDARGCSGMLGDARGCPGVLGECSGSARGCSGMLGDAWGCSGMLGDAWGARLGFIQRRPTPMVRMALVATLLVSNTS